MNRLPLLLLLLAGSAGADVFGGSEGGGGASGPAEGVEAPDGTSAIILGADADDANGIGVVVNNSVSLTNASARLLSIKNNGTEKAYFDKDGYLRTNEVLTISAGTLSLLSSVADGGAAVASVIGSTVALSTSGAKLLSLKNNGVEKAAFTKDGYLDTPRVQSGSAGLTLLGNVADGASAVGVTVNNGVTLANAGARLLSVQNNGTEKAYFDINGSLITGQLWARATEGLSFTSRIADGASAVGITLDNSTTLSTSGAKLLSVKNNGTEKFAVDKDGTLDTLKVQPSSNASLSAIANTTTDGAAAVGLILGNSTQLTNATAKFLSFRNGASERVYMTNTAILPISSGTINLGSGSAYFANIYGGAIIASGGNISASNGYGRLQFSPNNPNVYLADINWASTTPAHRFRVTNTMDPGTYLASWSPEVNGTNDVLLLTRDGKWVYATTDSSGTPGAATISKPTGKVSVAAGASSVVVTSTIVTTASIIHPIPQQADATCTQAINAIPASGSFTINMNANCTANTKVAFIVQN